MKNTLLALCAALALVVSFTACSSLPPVSFEMELVSIERGADGNGKALLRFVNRGVVSYNLRESTHRVTINGRPAGTIVVKAPVGVPAQGALEQGGTFIAEKGAALEPGSANYRIDSLVIITLYDDNTEKLKMQSAGTVVVK